MPAHLPLISKQANRADSSINTSSVAINIFAENTTTIDMFGSAKYRNYQYGGDDHIAVVHTEKLPKLASIFVTSAIHKTPVTDNLTTVEIFMQKMLMC